MRGEAQQSAAELICPVLVPMHHVVQLQRVEDAVDRGAGQVQLSKSGVILTYTLDFNFDKAAFLPQGLTVSGPVVVNWSKLAR